MTLVSNMPTTAARAYRSLLRELRKSVIILYMFSAMCVSNKPRQSIFNRSERNPVIHSSFRTSLLDHMAENPEDLSDAVKDIEATAGFLRADRNYKVCPPDTHVK